MKVMQKLFAALCLVVLTSSISLAAAETVDLGPAKISMDLQSIGPYNVEKGNPSSSNHNYGGYAFTYEYFPATIKAGNTGNQVLIGLYQISTPQPFDVPIPQLNGKTGLEHTVEESEIMPPSRNIQEQPYYIDGYKGIAITINGNQNKPIYLIAYSPDMKDGLGKTVVIIGSDFPLDTTKSIFESVKTQLGQEGMMVQSNAGMVNMGQSNMGTMGQSNMAQSNTGMANMGQNSMGQSGIDMINTMKMAMDIMKYMTDTGQGNM